METTEIIMTPEGQYFLRIVGAISGHSPNMIPKDIIDRAAKITELAHKRLFIEEWAEVADHKKD